MFLYPVDPSLFQQSGIGSILLHDLHCTGTETNIWNCTNAGVKIHDCVSHKDVGVRCGKD